MIGPVFYREVVTSPRRLRFFLLRTVYVAGMAVLMCTGWLVLAGTQEVQTLGDMARFGALLFQILAPLQLALVMFFSAFGAAGAVAQEKDRRTLILLLMTRLANAELVLGKLVAALLNILVMVTASLPFFMIAVLLGGVSFSQVAAVFAVTVATAIAAGTLGSLVAFWREKTFQILAMTALVLVTWLGIWEAVYATSGATRWAGISVDTWAAGMSPMHAVHVAAMPNVAPDAVFGLPLPVVIYLVFSAGLTVLLNLIAIARVRVWNPSHEVRQAAAPVEADASIWGAEHDLAVETARAGHVDAQLRKDRGAGQSRTVWDNPILWREVRTWAYGKRIVLVRAAYLALAAMAAAALWRCIADGSALAVGDESPGLVPVAAKSLVPLLVVSLVLVCALAVTSITTERDGLSLDLLLVTDLSPGEFIFGKLGGVFWVAKEMVLLPMGLCVCLWAFGGIGLENLLYVLGGTAVMNVFVATLGIHCGMTYANSRTAIGVSLGVVFFLFLGVATCILMMDAFTGSFEGQMAPFLAFILGGGVGLYVSLGSRNPSSAIAAASLLVPFATFYAITSFLLDYTLAVFLVVVSAYGFTAAAMMVPALHEFDIATGRAASGDDE